MKKTIAILLTLILLLMIPCATLAVRPSPIDRSRMHVSSIKATCLAAVKNPVARYDTRRMIITRIPFSGVRISYLLISQDAGFVSHALKRAGIITSPMTYGELFKSCTRLFQPRNGTLMFNGSVVGFYLDGFVYYSTFNQFVCTKYRDKTWSIGWFNGL